MMFSPMLMLAVGIAFVLNGFYWNAHGGNAADTRWTAKITAERLAATEAARTQEQKWQGEIDGNSKVYLEKIAAADKRLRIALNSLRSRPDRTVYLPSDPRPDCKGSTGAELSRPDGEFLAGEAARADSIRAGLEACYAYADAIRK